MVTPLWRTAAEPRVQWFFKIITILILIRVTISHSFSPLRRPDLQPTVSAGSASSGLLGTARLHQGFLPGDTTFRTGKTLFCLGWQYAWKTINMKLCSYFPSRREILKSDTKTSSFEPLFLGKMTGSGVQVGESKLACWALWLGPRFLALWRQNSAAVAGNWLIINCYHCSTWKKTATAGSERASKRLEGVSALSYWKDALRWASPVNQFRNSWLWPKSNICRVYF